MKVPVAPLKKVPPAFNVPAPENIILEATPAEVMFPDTVTIPVDTFISVVFVVPVVPKREIEPAVKLPLPTSIFLILFDEGNPMLIKPVIVNVLDPLMFIAFDLLPAVNVTVEATAVVSTVTFTPVVLGITTSSVESGTRPQDHVPTALQLPALAVQVAASTTCGKKMNNEKTETNPNII